VSEPRFHYRAATATGEMVEGTVRAPSSRGALEELRRQRLFPVEIDALDGMTAEGIGMPRARATRSESPAATTSVGTTIGRWLGTSIGSRVDRTESLATAMRTLATLVGAGVPIERALGFVADQARQPEVSRAMHTVRRAVQGGASLAEALRAESRVVGDLAPAMAAGGEGSGSLDESLTRLAHHLEESAALRSEIRAALVYPALMSIVAAVGITVLLMFVVPRFVGMLGEVGGTLPVSTRLLVTASAIVTHGWWIWLPLIVLAVTAARRWTAAPANRVRWHEARLAWPVSGPLERTMATARFARALGMLLRSGVPLLPALRIARGTVGNVALIARLERASADVGRGVTLARALDGIVPPLALQLIAAGEASGALDALCLRVADTYDVEARRSVRSLVRLVEPVLILLFGLVVGFVALALLQAIYSVNAGGM
jgi:type II secretory pathway component PulF